MNNLLFRNQYRIETTRLQHWDYSQDGWYYVTICTKKRRCIFGTIKNYKMHLSPVGKIAKRHWEKIANNFSNIKIESFAIMPNHLHGILLIDNPFDIHPFKKPISSDPPHIVRRKMLLSKAIGRFKMQSSKEINNLKNTQGTPVWQARFYDHIIRKRESLHKISQYILNNPIKWEIDRNNPKNIF